MKYKWSDSEISKLIDLFPNSYDSDIAMVLNRTKSSIVNKAREIGLRKSTIHKSKCISKRNKMVGRDINLEFVKTQALKYKSRTEFQIKDSSCYKFARENNILDEVCSHMIKLNYSIPQLILKNILENILKENCCYNDRKTIKPYELDVYFEKFKLAFEYNGKGWHKDQNKEIDKISMCKQKNIKLIYILENNRNYELDIKKQLISNLEIINKATSKKITEKDILEFKLDNAFDSLIDMKEIKKIVNNYSDLSDFRKKEPKLYEKLCKLKINEELTCHMKRKRKKYTIDFIKNEIKNYTFLFDLIDKNRALYLYIKRHKLNNLISNLIRKK